MPTSPEQSDDYLAWRRERRQVARRHHPDIGGDIDVYLRQMRAVDERFAAGQLVPPARERRASNLDEFASPPDRLHGSIRRIRTLRHRSRRLTRRVRARIPRWLPGSRRYFDL